MFPICLVPKARHWRSIIIRSLWSPYGLRTLVSSHLSLQLYPTCPKDQFPSHEVSPVIIACSSTYFLKTLGHGQELLPQLRKASHLIELAPDLESGYTRSSFIRIKPDISDQAVKVQSGKYGSLSPILD